VRHFLLSRCCHVIEVTVRYRTEERSWDPEQFPLQGSDSSGSRRRTQKGKYDFFFSKHMHRSLTDINSQAIEEKQRRKEEKKAGKEKVDSVKVSGPVSLGVGNAA
jgi:hypothetical protein